LEEPWVTVAESSELAMALVSSGNQNRAEEIFSWLHQWKDPQDNLYWTGYVYPDKAFWPVEKTTWTAAAVLLAADTLYKFTDASRLFIKDWSE
jgi:GH15 family glucan-1,4-alpha-glucosidase